MKHYLLTEDDVNIAVIYGKLNSPELTIKLRKAIADHFVCEVKRVDVIETYHNTQIFDITTIEEDVEYTRKYTIEEIVTY